MFLQPGSTPNGSIGSIGSIGSAIPSSVTDTAGSLNESIGRTLESTATNVPDVFSSAIEWFKSVSYIKYIVIFLILAFLGINVFTILGKTSDSIGGPLRKIVAAFGWVGGETAKQVIETTADGIEQGVDVVEDVAIGGVDVIEKTMTGRRDQDTVDAALDGMEPTDGTTNEQPESGYCYIGSDRGTRSCARVGEADTCMSGDIFPTNETCINPQLRA